MATELSQKKSYATQRDFSKPPHGGIKEIPEPLKPNHKAS
jgi:hypothetical protein